MFAGVTALVATAASHFGKRDNCTLRTEIDRLNTRIRENAAVARERSAADSVQVWVLRGGVNRLQTALGVEQTKDWEDQGLIQEDTL